MKRAFHMGGEMECGDGGMLAYLTDSGRSSLRLILRDPKVRRRRFLVPDFLCGVILDIFKETGVSCEFYHIKEDLSIDMPSIKGKKFDAMYIIDYFGVSRYSAEIKSMKELLVVEDAVFLPFPEKPVWASRWIGFNSFRKIVHAADGSVIRSTTPLLNSGIANREAPFVEDKYRAKAEKEEYLKKGRGFEKGYLRLFEKAERLLEKQDKVYSISSRSLSTIFSFMNSLKGEVSARSRNRDELDRYIQGISIPCPADFLSFYPIRAERRDELRKYLFTRRIFLPVHWPKPMNAENSLYEKILAIPLDSRYGAGEMKRVALAIGSFYGKGYRTR